MARIEIGTFRKAGSRATLFACLLAFALAGAPPLVHAQANPAPTHQTSTPYTGDLSVFEYKDRDRKLQIQRVFDLLDLHAGSTLADIGAGSGWLTVRAAGRVGATGTVFAEDINPVAVQTIADRAKKENLRNIRPILGTSDDPKLPRNSVDVVMMLKVYHEIAQPQVLLRHLGPSLKSGARIGIIDRNGNGADHGLNEDVVVKEMAEAGFHRVSRYDFTRADGQDYFLIFKKN